METSRKYTYDVTKTSEIFDFLLKNKYIRLKDGHKLTAANSKGEFCKWHGKDSHGTNNCLIFRNIVQAQINKGNLKFPESQKETMVIDTDPFLTAGVNMVTADFRSLAKLKEDHEKEKGMENQFICCKCKEKVIVDAKDPNSGITKTIEKTVERNDSPFVTKKAENFENVRPFERRLEERKNYYFEKPFRPFYGRPWKNSNDNFQRYTNKAVSGRQQTRTFKPPANIRSNVWTRIENPRFNRPPTRTEKRRMQRVRAIERKVKEEQVTILPHIASEKGSVFDRLSPNPVSNVNGSEQFHQDDEEYMDGAYSESDEVFSINFGSMPPTYICNMVLILPMEFSATKETDDKLEGDVIETNKAQADFIGPVEEVLLGEELQETDQSAELAIFEKPGEGSNDHLKPLYIWATINDQALPRILVDNGAAVNILPTVMLKTIGKGINTLKPTKVSVAGFSGGITKVRGTLSLKVQVGSAVRDTIFFVVDSTAAFHALLGRDWIHQNYAIPSTLHQLMIIWNEGKAEVIHANHRPFVVGSNMVEANFYGNDLYTLKPSLEDGITCQKIVPFIAEAIKQVEEDIERPMINLRLQDEGTTSVVQ